MTQQTADIPRISPHDHPLVLGRLVRRYKRFLADIILDTGETVTAHCANPGSMKGLLPEGGRVALSPNTNPKAKLPYRWELVEVDGTWIGIHTGRTNKIAQSLIESGALPSLASYKDITPEVAYGENSRVDFLLTNPDGMACYVEVKSVTLRQGNKALFPDSVTKRGQKHLADLSHMCGLGHRAVMLFIVQRDDCTCFDIADALDPHYGKAFDEARMKGVDTLVRQINWNPDGWRDAGGLSLSRQSG